MEIKTTTATKKFAPVRYFMATVILALTLFVSVSLSSCSQKDTTIAPEQPVVTAVQESANVLNNDAFESAKVSSFWGKELYTADAGLMVGEQRRAGKQAIRFAWSPSQADGTNTMLHAELATAALPAGESERWYGFSSFMPAASMANESGEVIIVQWHAKPDAGEQQTVPPWHSLSSLTITYNSFTALLTSLFW
ncbi:MAG: heparin lyase I family protein [Spirosoma sp.]|nr:heparin lyase I family protein [Spirosoma sp.]